MRSEFENRKDFSNGPNPLKSTVKFNCMAINFVLLKNVSDTFSCFNIVDIFICNYIVNTLLNLYENKYQLSLTGSYNILSMTELMDVEEIKSLKRAVI